MPLENPDLAAVLITILAVLVLLQALVWTFTLVFLHRAISSAENLLLRLIVHSRELTHLLHPLASLLQPLTEALPKMEKEVLSILRATEAFAAHTGQELSTKLERLRAALNRIDRSLEQVFSNFLHATYQVHRVVMHPALEVSAALQGFKAILLKLFTQEQPPVAHSAQDGEDFI
ncbi:MAG: hypothetical protein HY645_08095 [Acidobacteria bacterium]|nr:hypothetical protein [Acidobacteriota bacterium]